MFVKPQYYWYNAPGDMRTDHSRASVAIETTHDPDDGHVHLVAWRDNMDIMLMTVSFYRGPDWTHE